MLIHDWMFRIVCKDLIEDPPLTLSLCQIVATLIVSDSVSDLYL